MFGMVSAVKKVVPVDLRIAVDRSAYRRRCRPLEATLKESDAQIVEKLKRDGVVLVPDYMPEKIAKELGQICLDAIEQQRADDKAASSEFFAMPNYGMDRLRNSDFVDPRVKAFFDDERILSIARSITTADVISHQRMIELRDRIGRVSSSDTWHFDRPHWQHKFKAFLYLNDIGSEQAPLRYLIGTFRDAPWRRHQERNIWRFGKHGPFGHFHLHEVEHLIESEGLNEFVCEGKAGTLVLFDARGLHRGTTLISGRRILLGNYFEL